MLGPFWLTVSTAVMVFALGFLYSAILGQPLNEYFPYLATGLVIWMYISGTVTDGCQTFISSEAMIKQIRVPFWTHVLRTIWRNLIILGHNAVIILVILAVYGSAESAAAMSLVVPAMLLVLLNGCWVTLMLGVICARFRDVPPIVASVMQLLFFVTPIIWHPSSLPGRQGFVYWNPLYHLIDIVRAPLLGKVPTPSAWLAVLGITIVGWTMSFLLFQRYRRRIAYWL